ncbi:MAG: hypothetical protein GEU90_13300 [Gemmatimonas sp.]|nr:hypothetical protein [Gemmatimonas sp.]
MMNRVLSRAAFALAIAVSLTACDSPIDTNVGQIEGVVLRSNGSEVARFSLVDQVVTGGLQVEVGQTSTFQVWGLSREEVAFPLSGYLIRDPTVVIGLLANASVEGGDRLMIQGLEEGTTTIRFVVERGGTEQGFEVRNIPLEVF